MTFAKTAPGHGWQHPKNTSDILCNGEKLGTLSTLHPQVLSKIDKNAAFVCFEIDLDLLCTLPAAALSFAEPSRFPSIDFYPSLNMGGAVYADIEKAAAALGSSELSAIRVIDIYEQDDRRSLTIRLSFSSPERTLSMDEVQQQVDALLSGLKPAGITLRV